MNTASEYRIYRLRYGVVLLCLSALCFNSPHAGHAQALRFQPQGAAAVGQGNAFAAQADDASAIHYNPAGLVQVERVQVIFGTALLGGSIKHTSPSGVDTRGDFGGSAVFPPPSHTYVSANLGAFGFTGLSRVTVGLGLTSPLRVEHALPYRWPIQDRLNVCHAAVARYQADGGL